MEQRTLCRTRHKTYCSSHRTQILLRTEDLIDAQDSRARPSTFTENASTMGKKAISQTTPPSVVFGQPRPVTKPHIRFTSSALGLFRLYFNRLKAPASPTILGTFIQTPHCLPKAVTGGCYGVVGGGRGATARSVRNNIMVMGERARVEIVAAMAVVVLWFVV